MQPVEPVTNHKLSFMQINKMERTETMNNFRKNKDLVNIIRVIMPLNKIVFKYRNIFRKMGVSNSIILLHLTQFKF